MYATYMNTKAGGRGWGALTGLGGAVRRRRPGSLGPGLAHESQQQNDTNSYEMSRNLIPCVICNKTS